MIGIFLVIGSIIVCWVAIAKLEGNIIAFDGHDPAYEDESLSDED